MTRGAETKAPLTNGTNGGDRDACGRFVEGNPGGPGNPHAKAVATWRNALVRTITPADIEAVVRKLVKCARAGEAWAVREVLDRCLGKARQQDAKAFAVAPVVATQVNIDLGEEFRELVEDRNRRLAQGRVWQPAPANVPRDAPRPARVV